jgi:NTP pyrophosphatase (non-canonical NTP hydrolase)
MTLYVIFAVLIGLVVGGIVGFIFARTRPSIVYVPTTGSIIRAITDANPDKHHDNLIRRIMKQMEELGEAAEAYLNVTSAANGKGKTWDDVREELADQVIVAVDCALTPTPDQVGMTREDIEQEFARVVAVKLAKWKRNRDTGKAATDAE